MADVIASAARTSFVDSMHTSLWIAAGPGRERRRSHLHPAARKATPTRSPRCPRCSRHTHGSRRSRPHAITGEAAVAEVSPS
jgi:hypothetical protein